MESLKENDESKADPNSQNLRPKIEELKKAGVRIISETVEPFAGSSSSGGGTGSAIASGASALGGAVSKVSKKR